MSEPQGPWAYLAERAGQVRELRAQYLDRQRAAWGGKRPLATALGVGRGLGRQGRTTEEGSRR